MLRLRADNLYLHKLSRQTNTTYPNSRYVTATSFPDQITELINSVIVLKYRTKDFNSEFEERPATRPSDDRDWIDRKNRHAPQEDIGSYYREANFIVLRADASEPYVLIAYSNLLNMLVVNSTKPLDEDRYTFEEKVCTYSDQIKVLYQLEVTDQYFDEKENPGVVYRADDGEPFNYIVEDTAADGTVRYILGTEVVSLIEQNISIEDYIFKNKHILL